MLQPHAEGRASSRDRLFRWQAERILRRTGRRAQDRRGQTAAGAAGSTGTLGRQAFAAQKRSFEGRQQAPHFQMSLWAQWPRPPLRPEVRCAPRLRGSVQQPIRLAWALCSDVSLAPHAFRSPGRHRQHPCVWPCGAGVSQKQPSEVTADQALRAVALGRGVFVAVTCVTYASRARRCVEPPSPPPHLLLPRGDRPPSVSPLPSPGPGPPVWTLPSSSALHLCPPTCRPRPGRSAPPSQAGWLSRIPTCLT